MAYQVVGDSDVFGLDLNTILATALMFALGLWLYYKFLADEE